MKRAYAGLFGVALAIPLLPTSAWAWTETVLHSFQGTGDGAAPFAGLVLDSAGALYGTTIYGGIAGSQCSPDGCGVVFKLAPRAGGASGWAETVLHHFEGADGATPFGGLTMDPSGTLYGTTQAGGETSDLCGTPGQSGCGLVFQLAPGTGNSPWKYSILHKFSGTDGGNSQSTLIIGPAGVLYGTTVYGGLTNKCTSTPGGSCGVAFGMVPPAQGKPGWTEEVLDRMPGTAMAEPWSGLIRDSSGALYGTSFEGGVDYNDGTVFKLVPPIAGQTSWTKTVLHRFAGARHKDGMNPIAGVIVDSSGALYGTTYWGGGGKGECPGGCGEVFRLNPPATGQTAWTETVLYRFENRNDGFAPFAGLVMDSKGVLYGTASDGGAGQGGTIYSLTPPVSPGTSWTFTLLHSFTGKGDGRGPRSGLLLDASGVLYGTAESGGTLTTTFSDGAGVVFKLTP